MAKEMEAFPTVLILPLYSDLYSNAAVSLFVSGKGEDTYPDLLALFIALLVTVIIALGVRNSVGFNNILNVVNLVVWIFIVIAGLFFLSASNWGGGKFLPYGWSGVRY